MVLIFKGHQKKRAKLLHSGLLGQIITLHCKLVLDDGSQVTNILLSFFIYLPFRILSLVRFFNQFICEKPRATEGSAGCYKRNLFFSFFFSHITQTGTYGCPRCLKYNSTSSYQMILYAYLLFIKFYYFQEFLRENLRLVW